jgi:hypothetical protein
VLANGILVVKWTDKETVHMLSTKHNRPKFVEKNEGKKKLKANCVVEDNSATGGVHTHDLCAAPYPLT